MEYLLFRNYSGTRTDLSLSRFGGDGMAPEVHAIITLDPADDEHTVMPLEHIASAASILAGTLAQEGLRPVMCRWFLSDAANQSPLLPRFTAESIAISKVGQPPANATKAALWIYFLPVSATGTTDDGLTIARRDPYTHFFMASASVPAASSHDATVTLLDTYSRQLTREGSSLADGCIRTWFFVRDIDYFYNGVVSGRNEIFASHGLTPQTHFIASTGIEGHPEAADVTVKMDAWAVGGLRPGQISYIQAPEYLNPTYEYGVAFERATAIDYGDRRHLIISGTASIDNRGQIVHHGDIEGQTHRMLENVGALLNEGGMNWENVAHMIIYLRDSADLAIVERIMQSRFPKANSAPRVIVCAPVCRPGWLIEMECMAIAPVSIPAYAPF